MNKQQLFENIKKKQSFLCVGLDTDIKKIPQHLLSEEDPIFAFNKAIIPPIIVSLTSRIWLFTRASAQRV
jgi:orotidine-5'-phosphate decarboxylase